MVEAMSVHSSSMSREIPDSWSLAAAMAGVSNVPIAHALDLSRFFPVEERNWADILVTETRRHLGACLLSVETSLRLAMDSSPAAAALASMPAPLCWPLVQSAPTLLSAGLLNHMRLRAGTGILIRQIGRADGDEDDGPSSLESDENPDVAEAALALSAAAGRWAIIGGEGQAMRPDLPSETFVDLLWTAAAALLTALRRSGFLDESTLIATIEAAGRAVLARHDEESGAFARADWLVRKLNDRADEPALLGQALAQRNFLLFAALAARRTRMETISIVDSLLTGRIDEVAALCHALGGSAADYRHLLLALRPVRLSLNDAAIVAMADAYAEIGAEEADAAVAVMRLPAELRGKLAMIGVMSAR